MANRELRNMEKLEMNEILAELKPLPTGFLDPKPISEVSPGPAGSF
jgi:hypothetical protein